MPTTPAKPRRVPAPRKSTYETELRPLDPTAPGGIAPYEFNAKVHTPKAIAKLAAVIKVMGQLIPIVVDTNGVIAKGHRTRLAMLQLGYTEAVVHVARKATPEQLRQWRIDDNRLSEDSPWDEQILRGEMGDLRDLGVDLTLMAFEPPELERMFTDPGASTSGSTAGGDQFLCVVTCRDEGDLKQLYEELDKRGYPCKLVT